MVKKSDESKRANEPANENAKLSDACEADIRIVTDGEMLEDGIVELTDKKAYIDEP